MHRVIDVALYRDLDFALIKCIIVHT